MITRFLLIGFAILCIIGINKPISQQITLEYEMLYARIDDIDSCIGKAKIWRNGNKMRIEYEEGNIILLTDDSIYVFSLSKREGYKLVGSDPIKLRQTIEYFAYGIIIPEMVNPQFVGSTIFQGFQCDILESRFELPDGSVFRRREYHYKLPKTNISLPMKGIWWHNNEVKMIFEIKNLKIGIKIDPKLFKLPSGIKIIEKNLH
jgi:outer membrane lipoprotein-sorting protein